MGRSWCPRIRSRRTIWPDAKSRFPGADDFYLALKLFEPNVETVTMPFDKILDAVQAKEVEAGLLIHEGQLLFSQMGLHRVVDLGLWWQERRVCRCRWAELRFAGAWAPNLVSRWRG